MSIKIFEPMATINSLLIILSHALG